MPVNKAAQVVPITPIPIVTSIIEKPASFRRRRELSDRLIFINVFRSSYPLAIGLPVAGICRTPEPSVTKGVYFQLLGSKDETRLRAPDQPGSHQGGSRCPKTAEAVRVWYIERMDQAGVIGEARQPSDGSGGKERPNVDPDKGEADADRHEPL
jgi:hypothetical protein